MFNLHFKFYFCSLGLDTGDRQVLEQKYKGSDPPCLLDSSDGRWDWNLKQQTPSGNPTLDKCIKLAPNLIPNLYVNSKVSSPTVIISIQIRVEGGEL